MRLYHLTKISFLGNCSHVNVNLLKWSCDKAATPLLKLIFKKAAAPLLKLFFLPKSSHTYINKMLKTQPPLCESKFSKSSCHWFYLSQTANSKAIFATLKQSVTGGAVIPYALGGSVFRASAHRVRNSDGGWMNSRQDSYSNMRSIRSLE